MLLATPLPAAAQQAEEPSGQEVVVTTERNNQTLARREGQVGTLGDKAAEDVSFSIRSYLDTLINQQPQMLGQVLENDPTIRTSYGFGNASEQFVVRGFTLFGDDVALEGLQGINPAPAGRARAQLRRAGDPGLGRSRPRAGRCALERPTCHTAFLACSAGEGRAFGGCF